MKCNLIVSILLSFMGILLIYISKKLNFKKDYFCKCIAYLLFYTAIFVWQLKNISIPMINEKLDVFVSVSATLAGFVFTGLAIILALIEFEHIKNLFKYGFLDNLFYKGYASIGLSIFNILIYFIVVQYDLNNSFILLLNQYIFGASLLLLILLMIDFIFAIKQLKINLKRK